MRFSLTTITSIKKQKHISRIIHFFIILILIGFVSYFLFLKSTIAYYQKAKQSNNIAISMQKKNNELINSNNKVKKALAILKNKQIDLYNSLNTTTPNTLLQMIMQAATQSGFAIISATPSNPNLIQLRLSGDYADLFHLINQFNKLAWPLTLIEFNIADHNHINISVQAVTS